MGNRQVVQPFTRKDLEVLVKLSGKTENEIENWYNEFHIESNETDRMNKRQFQTYYTKLRKNPRLNQITDHIFRVFDKDNSGTIDFREFLLGYIASTSGTNREKFEYAFELYDINDDDRIDQREASKILNIICRIIGIPEDDAQVYTTTVMISFDTNQDKILSKQEFINGCLNDPSLARIANPFDL